SGLSSGLASGSDHREIRRCRSVQSGAAAAGLLSLRTGRVLRAPRLAGCQTGGAPLRGPDAASVGVQSPERRADGKHRILNFGSDGALAAQGGDLGLVVAGLLEDLLGVRA